MGQSRSIENVRDTSSQCLTTDILLRGRNVTIEVVLASNRRYELSGSKCRRQADAPERTPLAAASQRRGAAPAQPSPSAPHSASIEMLVRSLS